MSRIPVKKIKKKELRYKQCYEWKMDMVIYKTKYYKSNMSSDRVKKLNRWNEILDNIIHHNDAKEMYILSRDRSPGQVLFHEDTTSTSFHTEGTDRLRLV